MSELDPDNFHIYGKALIRDAESWFDCYYLVDSNPPASRERKRKRKRTSGTKRQSKPNGPEPERASKDSDTWLERLAWRPGSRIQFEIAPFKVIDFSPQDDTAEVDMSDEVNFSYMAFSVCGVKRTYNPSYGNIAYLDMFPNVIDHHESFVARLRVGLSQDEAAQLAVPIQERKRALHAPTYIGSNEILGKSMVEDDNGEVQEVLYLKRKITHDKEIHRWVNESELSDFEQLAFTVIGINLCGSRIIVHNIPNTTVTLLDSSVVDPSVDLYISKLRSHLRINPEPTGRPSLADHANESDSQITDSSLSGTESVSESDDD